MTDSVFEPKIMGFLCSWCSYAGADMAGVSRVQYPANIRIVRVMCSGRVDLRFVIKAFESGADGVLISGCHPGDCHYTTGNYMASITGISERAGHIVIFAGAEVVSCDKEELLVETCKTCADPVPVIFDEMIGNPMLIETRDPAGRFADVEELEQLSVDDRFAFWQEQLSKCTLCYACQTICPMCFCKECSVTLPKHDAKRKERSQATVLSFHMLRAYHMMGRCTGCAECERVCPVDIPLSKIFKKVEKDCLELFDYQAGLAVDGIPPLSRAGDTGD